jgi:hypothetical protein
MCDERVDGVVGGIVREVVVGMGGERMRRME